MFRTIVHTSVAVALALVALSATVAYAGSSDSAEQQLSGPFLGTYTGSLTLGEAATLGDIRMKGKFRLALRANGTYSVTNPLDGTTNGRLAALPGKKLRFYKDSGCEYGGFERPKGGIYAWSVNGRKLTLRLVSEGPCTGRTGSLAWVVWTRK